MPVRNREGCSSGTDPSRGSRHWWSVNGLKCTELGPSGTGFDALGEESARPMWVRRLMKQHRFEAPGNSSRHPRRQHNDVKDRRCGSSNQCSPTLLGHLVVSVRLNRSRTAWSNRRLTSRVMTAPTRIVSTIWALLVCSSSRR